jgi:hypothetical protein
MCFCKFTTLLFLLSKEIIKMEFLLTGRISTVDLPVLTSTDQLLLMLKKVFFLFTKQAILMRRLPVQSLPLR